MKIPKTLCIPYVELPFSILEPFRKWKHSSTICKCSISPPTRNKIMKRGITKPHQLELKRWTLKNKSPSSKKKYRPMIITPPVQNFQRKSKGSTNLETRNKKFVKSFWDSINPSPSIIPSIETIRRFNIREVQKCYVLPKKSRRRLQSSQTIFLLL